MSRSANWVFTINNYTEETIEKLCSIPIDDAWIVFGEEVAPSTGTRHLQGYIGFEDRKKRRTVERMLGGHAWLEPTENSIAAIGYAIKDGVAHSNQQLPEGFGDRVHIVREVCEEMGMKKYLYEQIGSLAFDGPNVWSTKEEARVCAGYLAWCEGIKWYDPSSWLMK